MSKRTYIWHWPVCASTTCFRSSDNYSIISLIEIKLVEISARFFKHTGGIVVYCIIFWLHVIMRSRRTRYQRPLWAGKLKIWQVILCNYGEILLWCCMVMYSYFVCSAALVFNFILILLGTNTGYEVTYELQTNVKKVGLPNLTAQKNTEQIFWETR